MEKCKKIEEKLRTVIPTFPKIDWGESSDNNWDLLDRALDHCLVFDYKLKYAKLASAVSDVFIKNKEEALKEIQQICLTGKIDYKIFIQELLKEISMKLSIERNRDLLNELVQILLNELNRE